MKIYFDVSTLNPKKVTGVGVYMLQLLQQFSQVEGLQIVPSIKLSRIKNKKNIQSALPQKRCEVLLPFKFCKGQETLYHGPDFKTNLIGGMPKIVTIHDMVVFEEKYNRPDFYEKGKKDLTAILSSESLDAVIVNSEFTKSQVLRFFPRLQGKVHVTYLGCNRNSTVLAGKNIDLPEKYILFLGTLEKRKNLVGVIKTFEALRAQGFKEKLVLAGATGFGSEEIQSAIENSPVKEHIVRLNYVANNQISELFQRAEVFFFPSWYEGFGIPVLEAMSFGCPVVTSSGGALEEICGEAALFADPQNTEEMTAALKDILSDPELRASMQEKGLIQAQKFTWEKCAIDTVQVYKKVLQQKHFSKNLELRT